MNKNEKTIDAYINQKPVLQNEEILLREMNIDDVGDLREWMPIDSLYKYWGKKPGKVDKNPELLFDKQKKNKSIHWGIVDIESDKVIGDYYLYLIENNRMAKIAYRVSPSCHGRGIATKATEIVINFVFKETELQRIWTEIDVRNISSEAVLIEAVLIKNGFTKEGEIRQGKMVNTYCDYFLYAILKEDFLKTRKL